MVKLLGVPLPIHVNARTRVEVHPGLGGTLRSVAYAPGHTRVTHVIDVGPRLGHTDQSMVTDRVLIEAPAFFQKYAHRRGRKAHQEMLDSIPYALGACALHVENDHGHTHGRRQLAGEHHSTPGSQPQSASKKSHSKKKARASEKKARASEKMTQASKKAHGPQISAL